MTSYGTNLLILAVVLVSGIHAQMDSTAHSDGMTSVAPSDVMTTVAPSDVATTLATTDAMSMSPSDETTTISGGMDEPFAMCTAAMMTSDANEDEFLSEDEYLNFANEIAASMCLPVLDSLNLNLQTTYLSIACNCDDCCVGDDFVGIALTGVSDTYLREACLLTRVALGANQC